MAGLLMDEELLPFFGNPNVQRQGARARALAAQRDVNTLPDPRTYAAISGLLGQAPDEMGFSVMNPAYEDIQRVAKPAFAVGTALGVAPMMRGMNLAPRPAARAPSAASQRGAVTVGQPQQPLTVPEYQGSHKAPNAALYGATLDDLTKIMPANVYTREGKNLYGLNDPVIDRDWWMAAMKAKGNPNYEVEVYRAVPKGVKNINSGDWVTTSKKYAQDHGENVLSGDFEIISKKVKARTLSTAGDPQEYGYHADPGGLLD